MIKKIREKLSEKLISSSTTRANEILTKRFFNNECQRLEWDGIRQICLEESTKWYQNSIQPGLKILRVKKQ